MVYLVYKYLSVSGLNARSINRAIFIHSARFWILLGWGGFKVGEKETDARKIEDKIYSIFANVASSVGYSDTHGKIIAVLLVEGNPVSLQEISKKTGYSPSMISLSMDFLEVLGVIKRVKKTADRQLYIELTGDLLESLKRAILIRTQKSIHNSLAEFEETKEKLGKSGSKNEKILKTLEILEKQIKRLEGYVNVLANVRLP